MTSRTYYISSGRDVPSEEKCLSICLQANGFSFSVVSTSGAWLSFGEVYIGPTPTMTEAVQLIRNRLAEGGVVPVGYHSMELVVLSRYFVMVPDALYEPGNDRQYLKPLAQLSLGTGVYSHHHETLGAQVVFAGDNTLVSAFKIALPGVKVMCQFSKMIGEQLIQRSATHPCMLLHVREGAVDVAVASEGALVFANSFDQHETSEVLFTAINVMKQLHVEGATLETMVCGDVDRARFAEMRRYFPQLTLYCGKEVQVLTAEMAHLPAYKHALILS